MKCWMRLVLAPSLGLLGIAIQTNPAEATALLKGWTVSDHAGKLVVTILDGGLVGSSVKNLDYQLKVRLPIAESLTLTFSHDGSKPGATEADPDGDLERSAGILETFFSLTLLYENTGATDVSGLLIAISDVHPNAKKDGSGNGAADHSEFSHMHSRSWRDGTPPSSFECKTNSLGDCSSGFGSFSMTLGPGGQNNPVQENETSKVTARAADGEIPVGGTMPVDFLKLHDITDSVGGNMGFS